MLIHIKIVESEAWSPVALCNTVLVEPVWATNEVPATCSKCLSRVMDR